MHNPIYVHTYMYILYITAQNVLRAFINVCLCVHVVHMYCAFTQNRTFIPIKKKSRVFLCNTPGVYTHVLILLPAIKEILFLRSKYSFSSLKTKFLVKSPTPPPRSARSCTEARQKLRVWG